MYDYDSAGKLPQSGQPSNRSPRTQDPHAFCRPGASCFALIWPFVIPVCENFMFDVEWHNIIHQQPVGNYNKLNCWA